MKLWSSPYRRRWLLWGTIAVTFLLVNVYRLSTAVIAEALMAAFDITGAQLGTLHAMFFIVYAIMQIPTGVLVDRIGPRRTATVGAIVMNVGAAWFALADGYVAALVARFLIGLGGSVIFVSMLRFCANWYRDDEFGTMNGLSFAVGGIGGILATTPFAVLVAATDWQTSILGLAGVGLLVAIPTFLFVRDSPERAGFDPIEGVPEMPRLSIVDVRRYLREVLGDSVTWVVALLLFCTGGVNLTLFGLWGIPYVVQMYDTSVTFASTLTLLGGVGMVVGPPAIGWLSDRTGHRIEYVLVGTVLYTAVLAAIAITGRPPIAVVAFVFFLTGIAFGCFVLTYPIVQERHPSEASGIALGTINGGSLFGAAIFPTLMGGLLDAYWTGEYVGGVRVYTVAGYRMAFVLATVTGVVAVGCAAWLAYQQRMSTPEDTRSAETVR